MSPCGHYSYSSPSEAPLDAVGYLLKALPDRIVGKGLLPDVIGLSQAGVRDRNLLQKRKRAREFVCLTYFLNYSTHASHYPPPQLLELTQWNSHLRRQRSILIV